MSHWSVPPSSSLFPGETICIQIGDKLVTHRITEIRRESGEYLPPPPRTRWQRITRALTPPSRRKPLPRGTRNPDTVQIISVPVDGSAPDDTDPPRDVPAPSSNR